MVETGIDPAKINCILKMLWYNINKQEVRRCEPERKACI